MSLFLPDEHMRFLHILFFLVGVQLLINGVYFSSSMLTAVGAGLMCLFILVAVKKPRNSDTAAVHDHKDIGPTYHQMGDPHADTYFAPLALISLIIGALTYLFLPISDIYAKTAITLTVTGLLYILIATFAHGFRGTVKNVLGILFGGLLILGAGACLSIRWPNVKQSVLYAYNSLGSNNSSTNVSATHDTGSLTGLQNNVLTGDHSLSGDANNALVDTNATTPLTGSGDNAITYGDLIPYIVQKYKLNADGKPELSFTSIPATDSKYQSFKAAYYNRFFSKTVNPGKQVSCDNYIVFIGLAEKRSLSYTAADVYTAFRNEATKRGILNGCKKGAYVKRANVN